jgi:Tfp pilus assembly PilM family ATPase
MCLERITMTEEIKELSSRGMEISRYKARTNSEGAVAWSDVPCAPNIRMNVPKFDIVAVGAEEIDSKVFGLLASAGIQQELVEIREHGLYVTCFLRMSDSSNKWDSIEVFLFDEEGRVTEIWAL